MVVMAPADLSACQVPMQRICHKQACIVPDTCSKCTRVRVLRSVDCRIGGLRGVAEITAK